MHVDVPHAPFCITCSYYYYYLTLVLSGGHDFVMIQDVQCVQEMVNEGLSSGS